MNNVLSAKGVTKLFADGSRDIQILNELDFDLLPGEKVAIIGASGSGKTTLMQILAGIDRPTSGRVELFGRDLSDYDDYSLSKIRNNDMGFIYQAYHLLPEFTVLENVALPLMIGGTKTREAKDRALRILKEVDIADRANFLPYKLSGGEKQRTAIARALIINPKVIFADEPTGNLDYNAATMVINQLLNLVLDHHTSLIMVTHNKKVAEKMDKILLLKNGILEQQ
jgi:lipoprotein-releasing system ATP-binding protein